MDQFVQWEQSLRQTEAAFLERFGSCTAEQLNFSPAPGVWSVAQNIDHLIVINESYYPIVEAIRNGTYKITWLSKLGFMSSMFGNVIRKAVLPSRHKKMKTFKVWKPSAGNLPGDILHRYAEHHERFIPFMHSCRDLVEKKQIIASPANRNVVYSLEAAFDIITLHEQRHLVQALEIPLPF